MKNNYELRNKIQLRITKITNYETKIQLRIPRPERATYFSIGQRPTKKTQTNKSAEHKRYLELQQFTCTIFRI
jgi:hypothetical protein